MTTVTESYPLPMRPDERWYPDTLLTRLCPWPQRRCFASQFRPVKNEDGGTWGSQTEDLSVIVRQNTHTPIPPAPSISPVSSLSSLSSQRKYRAAQLAMTMILSLILRWWIVPLPFAWIYIYILTDTAKDPCSPPEPKEGTPTGQCRDDCFWFYLSNRNLNTCFDVLFNAFVAQHSFTVVWY